MFLSIEIFTCVCRMSGNKPKWLPYEIELPKTRRRPVAGRPRASSLERTRATPESARESHDGPRSTREGGRRREGRGAGSGRLSSERTTGNVRKQRVEPGDMTTQSSEDREPAESSNKSTTADISHSDRGLLSVPDNSFYMKQVGRHAQCVSV